MLGSGPLSRGAGRTFSRRSALCGLGALAAANGAIAQTIAEEVPPAPVGPDQPDLENEEALIAAVLRYLKLSRTQLLSLADTGRQIRRRYSLTSQAQERARRDAETIRETFPDEASKRIAALDQERDQAVHELSLFGATRLTHILDRLQIGLAWKLLRGQPPKWAKGEEILLRSGGFGGLIRSDILLLSSLDGALRVYRDGGGPTQDVIVGLDLAEGQFALERPSQLGRLGGATLSESGRIRLSVPNDGRPFPQRLAEVADPSVLSPEIQPFSQRLFLSESVVPVIEAMLGGREPAPSTRRPASPSGNPRLIRDYKMEQGLREQSGRGPDLEPQGGILRNGAYVLDAGMGLFAPDLGVTDHYTLQMVIRCSASRGYQKLIDFKDRAVDGGLYTYEGAFTFYTLALGGAPIEGDQRVLVQRNRTTRKVQVHVDFRPAFAFIDLDDEAVFEDKKGWFFIDDKATTREQGPGAIRWLTVTTGPLSR